MSYSYRNLALRHSQIGLFLASILSIFTAPSFITKAPAFHCRCLYRKYCWNRRIPWKGPMFSAPGFTGCCMQVVQVIPLYMYVGAPQTKMYTTAPGNNGIAFALLYVNLAAYCMLLPISCVDNIRRELVWLHLFGRETTEPQHHGKVRASAGGNERKRNTRCVSCMQSANDRTRVVRVPIFA